MNRLRIAIVPAEEAHTRRRLLAALESAYPIRFVPGDTRSVDAVIAFGAVSPGVAAPTLSYSTTSVAPRPARPIVLADSELLPVPIRGRTLSDASDAAPGLQLAPGATALATCEDGVLWATADTAVGRSTSAACAPSELAPGERLRDRFRPGHFMTLLPLIEFLRTIGAAPAAPVLRGSFMLDDPNLHWTSYGFASFPALARHANEHGYHVAMAMIPLDGWLARKGTVRLFNASRPVLSLLMHGNDHLRRELAQPRSGDAAVSFLAQALKRIESFERRTGAYVDRVMAPPHGAYSLVSARAMLKVGIEALSANYAPVDDNASAPPPLAGWHAADFVGGGLPVLTRYHLESPRDELVFRALLGQPIVLYGHHQDLASGLDVLETAARDVNALGTVRWSRLGEIAATNYTTRRAGDALYVRLLSRRVELTVPPGVTRLIVDVPGHEACDDEIIRCRTGQHTAAARFDDGIATFALDGGPSVGLTLVNSYAIDPASVPTPRRKAWPLVRRILTESRDRLSPVLSR